ncbi:MAG: hypothetical protein PVF58_22320 [Candidatus Methanofastidiosia archaeon]|jgi:hypothetical protein
MNNVKDRAQKKSTKEISGIVKEKIVCPVCKNVLHDVDLPNKTGVIEDNVYSEGGIVIVDSAVTIHCEFEHRHNEQKKTITNPHELIAVIKAEFDGTGICILFEIIEILDLKGGD